MWSIDLPVNVTLGKKEPKSHPLNLNWYRNAHFHILNNAKVVFANQIKPKVRHLPKISKLSLKYTLYPRTRQLCDTANVCSIVDKFFCDTLVDAGILEDDNYTILGSVQYEFGEIDPSHPRVTVEIIPINTKEEEPMKITLDQNEIETAVHNYVNEQVSVKPGQTIQIEFTAGRGANGLTASVDIKAAELAKAPLTKAPESGKPQAEPTTEASMQADAGPTADMAKGDHVAAASEAEAASPGLFSSL